MNACGCMGNDWYLVNTLLCPSLRGVNCSPELSRDAIQLPGLLHNLGLELPDGGWLRVRVDLFLEAGPQIMVQR